MKESNGSADMNTGRTNGAACRANNNKKTFSKEHTFAQITTNSTRCNKLVVVKWLSKL